MTSIIKKLMTISCAFALGAATCPITLHAMQPPVPVAAAGGPAAQAAQPPAVPPIPNPQDPEEIATVGAGRRFEAHVRALHTALLQNQLTLNTPRDDARRAELIATLVANHYAINTIRALTLSANPAPPQTQQNSERQEPRHPIFSFTLRDRLALFVADGIRTRNRAIAQHAQEILPDELFVCTQALSVVPELVRLANQNRAAIAQLRAQQPQRPHRSGWTLDGIEQHGFLIHLGLEVNLPHMDDFILFVSKNLDKFGLTTQDWQRLLNALGGPVRFNFFETMLQIAARTPNKAVVNLLLGLGANVNARNSAGRTALHHVDSVEIERILISRGAQPSTNNNGLLAPLHCATNPDVIRFLAKELHQNVDQRDGQGYTPLHVAAYYGQPERVRALLAAKASPALFTRPPVAAAPKTAAVIVIESGKNVHAVLTELLNARIDVNAPAPDGNTLLHNLATAVVAAEGRARNAHQPMPEDPWHLNVARLLLDRGANPRLTNLALRTPRQVLQLPVLPVVPGAPIQQMAGRALSHFLAQILEEAEQTGTRSTQPAAIPVGPAVRTLAQRSALPGVAPTTAFNPTHAGLTPAQAGALAAARAALQAAAHHPPAALPAPQAPHQVAQTAGTLAHNSLMTHATPTPQGVAAPIAVQPAPFAPISAQAPGQPMVQPAIPPVPVPPVPAQPVFTGALAPSQTHAAPVRPVPQKTPQQLLWDAIEAQNAHGVQEALVAGAKATGTNSLGEPPLHHAARYNNGEIVQRLIDAGAPVDKPHQGLPALYTALANNAPQALRALLDGLANPNVAHNVDGATPLHEAARDGQIESVRILIEYHAKLNATTRTSETPLHYAAAAGHADVVEALLIADADVNGGRTDGWTPLRSAAEESNQCYQQKKGRRNRHHTISLINTMKQVVQILLRHHARVTPEMIATAHSEIKPMLETYYAGLTTGQQSMQIAGGTAAGPSGRHSGTPYIKVEDEDDDVPSHTPSPAAQFDTTPLHAAAQPSALLEAAIAAQAAHSRPPSGQDGAPAAKRARTKPSAEPTLEPVSAAPAAAAQQYAPSLPTEAALAVTISGRPGAASSVQPSVQATLARFARHDAARHS